jgi:hypothetical protein
MPCPPWVLLILLPTLLLSGCATLQSWESSAEDSLDSMQAWLNHRLKAQPAAGAGFVPMAQLAKDPDLPFDKAWLREGLDWDRYRTIYIAPVHTDYLKRANRWPETARADRLDQDIQNLATFMRIECINAFLRDPQHRWDVVMSPEPGSLTLALALTELVPSHVLLNAVKIAGPYGTGLAAAALERETESQSTVAFEARVHDTDSRLTLAMFADRQYAIVRPFDLKGITWYGNAKDIMQEWARQLVAVVNRRPGESIRPAKTFSLTPW